MACDQVEYCGSCEHYEKCIALAKKGVLHECKASMESNGERRSH